MKLARLVVVAVAALLCGGGFVASQLASLNGDSQNFATRMDEPPIRMLALLLLVAAVSLAFVKDSSGDSGGSEETEG
jgi:hypothetical protein